MGPDPGESRCSRRCPESLLGPTSHAIPLNYGSSMEDHLLNHQKMVDVGSLLRCAWLASRPTLSIMDTVLERFRPSSKVPENILHLSIDPMCLAGTSCVEAAWLV